MNVTFDSSTAHAAPGEEVSFGFWIENPAGRRLPCAYRLETRGPLTVSWRVDAPTSLAAGERMRGELQVRAPKNDGTDSLTLLMRLRVSTDDRGASGGDTCTLVVRPARFAVRPTVAARPDGTVAAKLSFLRHGRPKVDAEVKFGLARGWRLDTGGPSVTVHSSSGRGRRFRPRATWPEPRITLNPDGTVTVKISLANHGDFDVSASVRLRHGDGWWFVPEDPEVTVKAQHGPVDVSATFRPSPGRRVGPNDELSVEVRVNGVTVAETRAPVRHSPAALPQVVALVAAVAITVAGTAAAVDLTDEQPISVTLPGVTEPSTTTTVAVATTSPPTTRPVASTSTVPAPVPDECPNVPGDQPTLPTGFAVDAEGSCVPEAQPCDASTESGGEGRTVTVHEVRERGPSSFRFEYDTAERPDTISIRYEGREVFHVGPIGTEGPVSTTVDLPPGTSTQVEVTVEGESSGTRWGYTVHCAAAG